MENAMDIIKAVKPSLPELLVIADQQSKGQGTGSSIWESPLGGLWFTYCFSAETVSHQLTLLIGLSLYKTFVEHFPGLTSDLRIKWPNDILAGNNKLAGILVTQSHGFIYIGIGINTNVEIKLPETSIQPSSLQELSNFEISNIALLKSWLSNFKNYFTAFTTKGISFYIKEINSILYGTGRNLVFDTGRETIKGILQGINNEGMLILKTETGETRELIYGSIKQFV
jgi:BirA family biotin operon repressor/biotin-[acetyl-CoA-carboxylase] ligase